MPPKVKQILFWIAFAFLIYAVATAPDKVAGLITSVWDLVWGILSGFGNFFAELVS